MTNSGSPKASPQMLADIDLVCDAFEREWTSSTPAQIEACLERVRPEFRPRLFRELLLIDVQQRLLRKLDLPSQQDVSSTFPTYREEVRAVFRELAEQGNAETETLVTTDREPSRHAATRSTSEPAATLDVFIEGVTKFGLMSREAIAEFLDAQYGADMQPTAEQRARHLVKHGRLTEFQARMIYRGRGDRLQLGNYTAPVWVPTLPSMVLGDYRRRYRCGCSRCGRWLGCDRGRRHLWSHVWSKQLDS